IERRDLWEKYGPQSPTGNFNSNPTEWMKVMTCPNDPTARTGNRITMVVNGGTRGNSDNQNTAMFDDSWNGSITACSAGDGTSQTILLSENVDARDWRDMDDDQICVCFQDSAIGFGGTVKNINVDLPEGESRMPRASAYHAGGINVAFADPHVTFIAETVDPAVWNLLFTPNGFDANQMLVLDEKKLSSF
ncbi:MAG: DUF1559 domain-containing protein, partial [Planctomycetales bacterium]